MTDTSGTPSNLEVHFLHSDDPRDGFHVMSTNPLVFFSFQTPIGLLTTHTLVRARLPCCVHKRIAGLQVINSNGATVATLNWTGPSALGSVTWHGPSPSETHMVDLVAPFQSMPE